MIENCPVKKCADDATRHGGETLKAMRMMRIKLKDCPECPAYGDCPVLAEFHATVDQVLLEIYEEWNLK